MAVHSFALVYMKILVESIEYRLDTTFPADRDGGVKGEGNRKLKQNDMLWSINKY